ncbi:MAG: PQQ-dependent sugar dehydrogenase [Pirellulales bacterium]
MRSVLTVLAVAQFCAAVTCLADEPPHGLAQRVPWTTSRLVGSPEPPLPYTVEPTFTKLEWKSLIYIAPEPGSDRLWTISQGGDAGRPNRLERIADDPATTERQTLVDLPDRLVYSVCFDPGFASNRQVYVFSNFPAAGSERSNRVSRFVVQPGPPLKIDPAREETILQWRSEGHDGGDLVFGTDGMLYIATGDGTGDSDTWNSGQTLDDLLGAILRIDVRRREGDRPYAIPADNPFVSVPQARGEVWAYGLRNPWRLCVDPPSGQIWVGNNGQDLWESAHLVRRGENYGWSVYEGSHPFYPQRKRGPTPHVPPTIEHSHADFRSLTGGVVYRGERLPELDGAYVYGDYSTGRIWAMKHDGQRAVWHRELADTSLAIAAFCVDQRGELLVADHAQGIFRLVPAPLAIAQSPFPTLLSETGLFDNVPEHRLAPGVIAYSVNAPGWADGASAERFLAVPANSQIEFTSGGGWNCPDGTALVQTLSLPAGDGARSRRIETRVLVRQQNEWAGYGYRWNDAQTDAALVPREGAEGEFASGTGDAAPQLWRFPSRAECLTCHSRAANFALSLSEPQMNREHDYGGLRDNQLRAFAHVGLFAKPLPKEPAELTRLVDPYDPSQELEARARAYLHVNCSVCHVSAGGGNAQMELGLLTARDDMKLFGARPQHDTFGIANAMLAAPGQPENSVLVERLSVRGRGQMPPLVVQRADPTAVELFRAWIASVKNEQRVVQQWKMDDLQGELANLAEGRSLEAGQTAFRKTGCTQCHRFAGEGGTVGPDLTGVERRLAPREVLESILQPSKTVPDQYASYAIETDDGRVVSGLIEREDDRVLVVRPISAVEEPKEIEKSTVVERHRLSKSNMPDGMVDVLEKEQVLNLLAYLLSGGKPPAAPAPPATEGATEPAGR